jgi:uncharacterized protein YndB with AHSA1/START domain
MADFTIEREIMIDAPIDVVWRTVTEADQIARWFADRVELEVRPGGHGELVFVDLSSGHERAFELAMVDVDRPARFSYRWGQPAGVVAVPSNSVLVEFTLAAESADRTRLRVRETGLADTAWSDDEKIRYAEDHRNGWSHHFGRLVDVFAKPEA